MKEDICIGCGVCVAACPEGSLVMLPSVEGIHKPVSGRECLSRCGRCARVCPFGEADDNEDTLGKALYGMVPGISHRTEVGYFLNAYLGHADSKTRLAGASGGLATWVACELLGLGEVDRVVAVAPGGSPDRLFEFRVMAEPSEVKSASGSAYYPLDITGAMAELRKTEGRYALVGLPCYVKAVRLAMERDRMLAERIEICLGITCGHLKTRHFSDCLVSMAGGSLKGTTRISFREKTENRRANDYGFVCEGSYGVKKLERWAGYADLQRSGEFKPQACIYCDDVFAETADAAFMDAWLPEYVSDWRGTSIVVARSPLIRDILDKGILEGRIEASVVGIEKVIASQAGVVEEKRERLAKRLWMASQWGVEPPRKRVGPKAPKWGERGLLDAQEELRAASNAKFASAGGDLKTYRKAMEGHFAKVRRARKIARLADKIMRLFGRHG